MNDKIYAGLSGKGLLKLLKDFTKGCISENTEAEAERKPIAKSPDNHEKILLEMKYVKTPLK